MLRTLTQVYARAPYRDAGLDMAYRVLQTADAESVCDLAVASIREVCAYAELPTPWQESSSVYGNADLAGASRVVDICPSENATMYVNLPGGRELYDAAAFESHGLRLGFLAPVLEPHPQPRSGEFLPALSVLDLVMSVPRHEVRRRLRAGEVVS
jgi:hypothetical protein